MTDHQLRSSIFQKTQQSNSTESLRYVRHSLSSVVPAGIVTSRVSVLESRPVPTSILPRRSTPRHTLSRADFGRRRTSRFGSPIVRVGGPHPDLSCSKSLNDSAQVDAEHSYLGLDRTRKINLDQHGITDGGSDYPDTYSQASGIHSPVQSQRLADRVQYDAVSPGSVTPKLCKSTFWGGNDMDHLEDREFMDASGNKSYFRSLTSIFPTLTSGIGLSDMPPRNVNSRRHNTMKSDNSALTTSTVRRQSVRDLFDERGIERPHGLVPDVEISHDDIHNIVNLKIRCCNCSWYNDESSNWCVNCNMVLRSVRSRDSLSLISPKGEPNHAKDALAVTGSSSPVSSGKQSPRKTATKKQIVSSMPGPASLQPHNQVLCPVGGVTGQNKEFPSFNLSQSRTKSLVESRKTTLAEQPLAPTLLKGSRKATLVKDSPFMIADQLSSPRSSRSFPIMIQGDSIHSPGNQSKTYQHPGTKPTGIDCESLTCLATHEDHEPYRHAVFCSSRKRHIPEEIDNGYVADTSFADDSSNVLSVQPRTRSLNSRNVEASHESNGSTYVECRGYPRTGHGRHGSATSGALGQCQHCIDDCQCTSCRNTHHSVRCCMNENHQGMVHHHHYSQSTNQRHNPLECSTFSSHDVKTSQDSRLVSPAWTATKMMALQPVTTLPLPLISPVDIIIEPPTKKSTLETPRDLPTAKQSTSFKEAAQSNSPPTGISNPKITKSPHSTQLLKPQAILIAADTALNVKAIADSPPRFKGRPSLPQDIFSSEQNKASSVGSWVQTLPDNVKIHDDCSCNIPSCDNCGSQRKQPRLSSVRDPCRDSKTLTQSSIASRNCSEPWEFGKKNKVSLLNQKLFEHQEELRKMEKQCDEMTEALARSSAGSSRASQSGPIVQIFQPKEADQEEKERLKSVERGTCTASSNEIPTAKKRSRWGLALVDKKSTPPCCTHPTPVQEHRLSEDTTVPCNVESPVQEHFLSDDPILDEMDDEKKLPSEPKFSMDPLVGSISEIDEHDCVWKARFVASQNDKSGQRGENKNRGDGALMGLTIVIHMEGKEDFVIKADLRKGRMIKTKAAGKRGSIKL